MKKIGILILIFGVFALLLTGCVNKESASLKDVSNLVSEYYIGNGENYSATLITGKKENPFVADGVAGKTEAYVKITIAPKIFDNSVPIGYKIIINEKEWTGMFTEDITSQTFSTVISVEAKREENFALNIAVRDKLESIELTPQREKSMIDWEEALGIGKESLKDEIEALTKNGKLNAEIYVKFICDKTDLSSKFYWYVAIIDGSEKIYAVLIDPVTKEIIAKRI